MAQTTQMMNKGRCECGGVRFVVTGPLRRVVYCHCGQCRRTSGHYVAATACAPEHLTVDDDDSLAWYRSSDFAERGFCRVCGSSVFWRPDSRKYVSIMAGTLDTPTGLVSHMHIHTADASDYYAIGDDLPQHAHEHGSLWENGTA